MIEELKPCRRCGLYVSSDGIEVTQTDTGTYTARFECPDCGEVAETCMRHSSEDFAVADVIDDWNRRWTDPALTARIEELEAERDRLREALNLIGTKADFCADECEYGPDATSFRSIADDAKRALEGAGE
jgi:hypothetical protein|nr:MAG TPA: restriction alleviation protein [Caudoviricetes sp.]